MPVNWTLCRAVVGDWIKANGLTNAEAARQLDVKRPGMPAFLRGKGGLSVESVVKIADITGRTVDELLGRAKLDMETRLLARIDEMMAKRQAEQIAALTSVADAAAGRTPRTR